MFDYTYNFELSKENLASLEIAVNPDNYCSPLLKTSIAETQKQLTEDSNFKNKFYSLCFCSIISQMWSAKATKFAVSYTHLTLPTNCAVCRSRWAPSH